MEFKWSENRLPVGEIVKLVIKRKMPQGFYLESDEYEGDVLLPNNQISDNMEVGQEISVFLYNDSEDRIIATKKRPKLLLGECGVLKVKSIEKIGTFLEYGLDRDLFLPYKETIGKIEVGDNVFVCVYKDKSDRLCATMKTRKYLIKNTDKFKKGDLVNGVVYEINEFGAFVVIDNKYVGFIHKNILDNNIKLFDNVTCNVVRITRDGKIDLSTKKESYIQINYDADIIYKLLLKSKGFLPYNDKTDATVIKNKFNMSKAAFKRAVGSLLKMNKIVLDEDGIKRKRD